MPPHPCLSCGVLVRGDSRCHPCQREWDNARMAKRGDLYRHGHAKRAREQVDAEPWCAWCGRTDDLTADHVLPGVTDSPLRTLCRSCNAARANRARTRSSR